jgi:hypothetical protein
MYNYVYSKNVHHQYYKNNLCHKYIWVDRSNSFHDSGAVCPIRTASFWLLGSFKKTSSEPRIPGNNVVLFSAEKIAMF